MNRTVVVFVIDDARMAVARGVASPAASRRNPELDMAIMALLLKIGRHEALSKSSADSSMMPPTWFPSDIEKGDVRISFGYSARSLPREAWILLTAWVIDLARDLQDRRKSRF
jgi:hypothetical protein